MFHFFIFNRVTRFVICQVRKRRVGGLPPYEPIVSPRTTFRGVRRVQPHRLYRRSWQRTSDQTYVRTVIRERKEDCIDPEGLSGVEIVHRDSNGHHHSRRRMRSENVRRNRFVSKRSGDYERNKNVAIAKFAKETFVNSRWRRNELLLFFF